LSHRARRYTEKNAAAPRADPQRSGPATAIVVNDTPERYFNKLVVKDASGVSSPSFEECA
jgi:hypothetical protein